MLPISAGLPLILSGKKRRRLEPKPARPRRGSAPVRARGGRSLTPRLPPTAKAGHGPGSSRGHDERARPSVPPGRPSSPGKPCGGRSLAGQARESRGRKVHAETPASGRATWQRRAPPAPAACTVGAAPHTDQ
jgi:hypothetical protein